MSPIVNYICVGFAAGILSGLMGIGGGIIVVPALIFLFGLSQHQAQGTTLAMFLPPIGILATWVYYKQGYVDVPMALFLCLGFFIGGFAGAKLAIHISALILQKVFGLILLVCGIRMIFFK